MDKDKTPSNSLASAANGPDVTLICAPARPIKKGRKMLYLFATVVALFVAFLVFYEARRAWHMHHPAVIDLCPPAQPGQAQPQGPRACRWVIPTRDTTRNDLPRLLELAVPWSEIDPAFPVKDGVKVTFQFWPSSARHANGLRYKKEHPSELKKTVKGISASQIDIFFKAFDGTDVYVQHQVDYLPLQPLIRIYRPLGQHGSMHWMVLLPQFETAEAMNDYVHQHIFEIDRKLVQFIDRWH